MVAHPNNACVLVLGSGFALEFLENNPDQASSRKACAGSKVV
jgi:hypothetical protein